MADISVPEAIQRLAEKTYDNTKELRRTRYQRRTEFTDLFGIPHTAQGDAATPAKFYISISKDMIYELQYCFKLVIQPFAITMGGGGTDSATVNVNNRSLSISGDDIRPNPHDHSTQPHNHSVTAGVTLVHTTASNFRISVAGVEITAYLKAQQGGDWIDGEGIFPTNRIEDEDDFYDILAAATVMKSEGRVADANKLLDPGFKEVAISANAPFQATLYQYTKYSNMGR